MVSAAHAARQEETSGQGRTNETGQVASLGAMLPAHRQYAEKFKDSMPSSVGKLISDLAMWDEADRRLLDAITTGTPIKDWTQFGQDLRTFYGDE